MFLYLRVSIFLLLYFLDWLSKGLVVVHPKRFDKLITSIRTTVDNEVVLVKGVYLSGYT
jgi:hypothetical protein